MMEISLTKRYIFTFAAITAILSAVDVLTGHSYENPFTAVAAVLGFAVENPEKFIEDRTTLLFASALGAAIPAALIVVAFAVIGRLVGRAIGYVIGAAIGIFGCAFSSGIAGLVSKFSHNVVIAVDETYKGYGGFVNWFKTCTTGLAGLTSETGGKFGTLFLPFIAMLLLIYSQYPFFGPLY